MSVKNAQYWINHLNLKPHPEGGYYKETFRSDLEVTNSAAKIKQACTSIYYLLENTDYSGFHRLVSDEIWYFHKGVPLNIHVIDEQGLHTLFELSDSESGNLSVVITGGCWFAAEVRPGEGFALVSCAVAPGFDFDEFEMAKKEMLTASYPRYALLFDRLCRM